MTIQKALKKNTKALMELPNVIAVGRGYKVRSGVITDVESIVCSVVTKLPLGQLGDYRVPSEVSGYLTDVIETGEIVALRTQKHRPAPGGVSIGHVNITAGTLGCLVYRDGVRYILSNNHVLADSNNASIGDLILQPGKHDGGSPAADGIATLEQFVPIVWRGEVPSPPSNCPIGKAVAGLINVLPRLFMRKTRLVATAATDNLIDAAIALPQNADAVLPEIMEIGVPVGFGSAYLGNTIMKSGRTTGLTHGVVEQVDVTVQVGYGGSKVAIFTDQIMAGEMCAGGDSGSAVLNGSREVVGLLFAGSDTSTVINRIENVVEGLGLDGIWDNG